MSACMCGYEVWVCVHVGVGMSAYSYGSMDTPITVP